MIGRVWVKLEEGREKIWKMIQTNAPTHSPFTPATTTLLFAKSPLALWEAVIIIHNDSQEHLSNTLMMHRHNEPPLCCLLDHHWLSAKLPSSRWTWLCTSHRCRRHVGPRWWPRTRHECRGWLMPTRWRSIPVREKWGHDIIWDDMLWFDHSHRIWLVAKSNLLGMFSREQERSKLDRLAALFLKLERIICDIWHLVYDKVTFRSFSRRF